MAKGENIFRRKDGRWEARYVKSREDTVRSDMDFVMEKKFSFYCDCWLDLRSIQIKTSSYVKYQNEIEKHVKPYLGDLYLKDITTEKISAFSHDLLNEIIYQICA